MKIMDFKNQMLEKMYDGTIKNVYFDTDIKDYRQDDIWFGGSMISFDYHNLTVDIKATGEIRAEVIYKDENNKIIHDSFVDKNDDGMGRYLKNLGIYSDNEILNQSQDYDKIKKNVEKQLQKDDVKKIYINYENGNNNWFEIVIYDNKNEEYLDTYEAYALTEILDLGMDGILDYVKDVAEDNFDENYEVNEMVSHFIENVCFEKAQDEFIKKNNLDAVQYERENKYNVISVDDNEIKKMYKNYTPEAMFKFYGISKPFDSKGYPTIEAKQSLKDINNVFFKDEPIENAIEFIVIGKDNTYKTPEETKFVKLLSKVSGNDCDKKTYEEFEKAHEQIIEMYKSDFDDEVENDYDSCE